MHFTRFLGLLANCAGGWEELTDLVELTPVQFDRILSAPEINAGTTADAPREGRLRIIRNGVRQGQSRLRRSIRQGRCTYRALTDYVAETFRQDSPTYVVTAGVTGIWPRPSRRSARNSPPCKESRRFGTVRSKAGSFFWTSPPPPLCRAV